MKFKYHPLLNVQQETTLSNDVGYEGLIRLKTYGCFLRSCLSRPAGDDQEEVHHDCVDCETDQVGRDTDQVAHEMAHHHETNLQDLD